MTFESYTGGCQCKAVLYEVEADISGSSRCNCSRCKPMGFVLAFAPRSQFRLKSGRDKLTEYRFNTKEIQHLFCSICGVESFAYGKLPNDEKDAAINVNCLEGVDISKLDLKYADGKNLR